MNALTKTAPLPPLDLARSLKTLSLPEWLMRSVNGLTVGSEEVVRADGVKAKLVIPTIRRSLAPTPAICSMIERRLDELRRAREAVDLDMAMAKVTELLLAFAGQAMNETGARARARGYITALEDLPAWAIADACRKWLRGEAGEQNYNFAPSPPVLRRIAEESASGVDHQIVQFERLLLAKVIEDEPEFTDEHCAEMRGRLTELFVATANGTKMVAQPRQEAAE
jgi:hypothetical protein